MDQPPHKDSCGHRQNTVTFPIRSVPRSPSPAPHRPTCKDVIQRRSSARTRPTRSAGVETMDWGPTQVTTNTTAPGSTMAAAGGRGSKGRISQWDGEHRPDSTMGGGAEADSTMGAGAKPDPTMGRGAHLDPPMGGPPSAADEAAIGRDHRERGRRHALTGSSGSGGTQNLIMGGGAQPDPPVGGPP